MSKIASKYFHLIVEMCFSCGLPNYFPKGPIGFGFFLFFFFWGGGGGVVAH